MASQGKRQASMLHFKGVIQGGEGRSLFRRVKIIDSDGFPLPWDFIVRGKLADSLDGTTLVLQLSAAEGSRGNAKTVLPRDEPWD